MKTKKILLLAIALIAVLSGFSQSQNVETILPSKDVNQTIHEIWYAIMGIESTVNIDINCDINNYAACDSGYGLGRLEVEVNWYNTNDEIGIFMLNVIKDVQVISKEMADFKTSSGFEQMDLAKEVSIEGGKYWIFTEQEQCINELTGPTGVTAHHTQIRSYLFDGVKIIKLDLKGYFTPEKGKEMLLETVQNIQKFDFSALANVVESK